DRLDAERPERTVEVLLARRVPPFDAEPFVPRGIAGRDEHVVDSRRVVLLQREDRPPPVRDELLARPRKQPVGDSTRVLGAVVLAGVVRDESPRVGHLPALHVDDAKPLTGADPHGAALAGWDVDRLADGAMIGSVGRTQLMD